MYEDHQKYDIPLKELLFGTNLSVREIAKELGISEARVSQRIHLLKLDWIPRRNRKISRGQTALTLVIKKLIPGAEVVNEFHIGEQLRLDVYCPKFKIAAEYHGRQHYEFVGQFHKDYDDFVRSQKRDDRKAELCAEAGITLVVFRYSDDLTEDAVFDRLLSAMTATPAVDCDKIVKKPKYSVKDSPYYEERKMKRRAFERDLRKKIKEERKIREQDRTSQRELQNCLDQSEYDKWETYM
jgi:predicted transcriptional regulator